MNSLGTVGNYLISLGYVGSNYIRYLSLQLFKEIKAIGLWPEGIRRTRAG